MIPIKSYMQLLKTASIEGITRENGVSAREEALKEWLKEWVEEVSDTQATMTHVINIENQDSIKYYLAEKLSQELMNECITVVQEPTKITTKVAAFRRRGKNENPSKS